LGFGLILAVAYILMRRERTSADEEIKFLSELGALFRHIERRVSAYFESPREWAASFSARDERISLALAKIRRGVDPSSALSDAVRGEKSRHGADGEVLKCISMLGADELVCERESIIRANSLLDEYIAKESARLTERARIRSALIALISLGAVIILI
jgi:hypothetical protein